jgi:hypothetical protein
MAPGADLVNPCVSLDTVRDAVTARGGKLIELTPGQWQFLRGVYAMNPEAPAGLPYGDRAMLAQIDGGSDGLVLFVDGSQACTTMRAPPQLLLLMHQASTGNSNHYETYLAVDRRSSGKDGNPP